MLGFLKRQVRRALRRTNSLACDNIALQHLNSFDFGYIPWTAAAIQPASLCAILNEIIINRRQFIVEFGSGISTLYAAQLLQESGGRLISFEHDEEWMRLVERQLAKHQLMESATIVHAPLTRCEIALGDCKWYECDIVRESLLSVRVDGVLVDGPPASSRGLELSRYPAVPVVKEFLSDSFFVYLDDINRSGEREIFVQWQKLLGLQGHMELVAGNHGFIRKGGRFATGIADFSDY
jgi:hypothetical protein